MKDEGGRMKIKDEGRKTFSPTLLVSAGAKARCERHPSGNAAGWLGGPEAVAQEKVALSLVDADQGAPDRVVWGEQATGDEGGPLAQGIVPPGYLGREG